MTDESWTPLLTELARWERHGKQAQFWLRDDDAVVPTAALDQLLGLCGRFSVPMTLAVVPKNTGQTLADHLSDTPRISVALHGWSHENHAPSGEKKQELGMHRGLSAVLDELRAGGAHLAALHETRFSGLLVPPWNRIDSRLLPHLAGVGIAGLSTFGPEREMPIPAINTHVDLIDWKGTRGGRQPAGLVTDIVHRLQKIFDVGGSVGFLTHHLVHDEPAWQFLETLLSLTTQAPGCAWKPVTDLLPALRQP